MDTWLHVDLVMETIQPTLSHKSHRYEDLRFASMAFRFRRKAKGEKLSERHLAFVWTHSWFQPQFESSFKVMNRRPTACKWHQLLVRSRPRYHLWL